MKAAPELSITFLGTGTSNGVPMIACDCAVCRSPDPRDKRTRTAILVRHGDTTFSIDTPPDFRTQILREGITHLDAVVYTHSHTDHIMGFDDLRRFCANAESTIPIHATPDVLTDLRRVFAFAFEPLPPYGGYVRPAPIPITGPFRIGEIELTPVTLPHGRFTVSGFILGLEGQRLVAYMTDCNAVPPPAMEAARGSQVLIIDALRHQPHPTHLTVTAATAIAREMAVARTLFTHISHDLGQAETDAALPPDIRLAHDGLTLTVALQ